MKSKAFTVATAVRVVLLSVLSILGLTGPLDAAPMDVGLIDAMAIQAKYGNLDQSDVEQLALDMGMGGFAGCLCGPTAAVNSFVFLQNMYPHIYDNKLVKDDPATMANAMVDTALNLAKNFMNSTGGTFIEDFIHGKQSYIDMMAPGSTVYGAQISIPWNLVRTDGMGNPLPNADQPATAPGNNNIAKPGYVQQNTPPTLGFIMNEIQQGEDVEAFVAQHYITLTGCAQCDLMTNMGTLWFVDPDDGMPHSEAITGLMGGRLQFAYGGGTEIFHVVKESPIPEPVTVVLLGIGVVGLIGCRWRGRRGNG